MRPFEHPNSQDPEDNEPLYCSAPHNPEDIIWPGSDTEQTPQVIQEKRFRYERHARRYLRGQLPVLQSARLRGPLDAGWINPWRYRPRLTLDWWQPGSKDMLFTRANVMKWASDRGLGDLTPTEALARCKAAANAEAEVRRVNLGGGSADGSRFGNRLDIGYQSDSSEDPLSQGDDIMHPHSGPILSLGTSGRSSIGAKQHMRSDIGGSLPTNSERDGVKREANLQWLKGPPVLKRTRRDSPTPPSPSPMRDFQPQKVRRQGHEYTSTRTLIRLQAHESPRPNVALPDGTHEEPDESEGLVDEQEDLDKLGDISKWTTVVPAVDSLHEPERAQNMLQRSTGDSDDDQARAISPPNERAFSTVRDAREPHIDSTETVPMNLLSRLRSSQSLPSNTASLEDGSFVTEVAPSSGDAGKFKYRKRRRKANTSVLSMSMTVSKQDSRGHGELSSKSPREPIALGLETKVLKEDNIPPQTSPDVDPTQSNDENQKAYPDSDLQPTEAFLVADVKGTEREPSLTRTKPDIDWDMLDDIEPRTEPSLRSGEHLQSPMKSDNAKQSYPPTVAHSLEKGAYASKELDPHPDLDKEIELITNSQSTEEIVQSQIWTEISLSMCCEPSLNVRTEIAERLSQRSASENSRRSQNFDNGDQIRGSPSRDMSHGKDEVDGEDDANKLKALATSTPHSYTQEDDSGEGCGLQSPWTADNIQQHPSVILQGRDEHGVVRSSNRDTQPDKLMVPDDSNLQGPGRPETPENDGIVPFKEFMTPTPSPTRSRGRPSLEGLPNTQALVEAATRNPWAKNSGPRSKKRVSFGPADDEELENITSPDEMPKSPPPPQNRGRPSQDDVFDDGTTAINTFQKHFATVEGTGGRLPRMTKSSFTIASPAISAMAEAFIQADRGTSEEQRPLASGNESPSRHLQPVSQAMANSSADNNSASPSRSPLRRGNELQMDLDQYLGEAGGFLEEWSVETELKKPTEVQSREGRGDRRRRLFG